MESKIAGSLADASFARGLLVCNPGHGYERKRSQLKTKTMGQKHWTKRSRKTGEFMGSEESREVQVGSSGKERQIALPA
jgi:hypothetical protein